MLNAATPRLVVIGSGTRGPFSFQVSGTNVRVTDQSDVRVVRYASTTDETGTLLILNTDYTVNNTDPDAVTVTLTSAQDVLTSSQRLLIERTQPASQDLSLVLGGDYSGPAVAAALDKIVEYCQDLRKDIDRKLTGYWLSTTPPSMPAPPTSSTKALGHTTAGGLVNLSDYGVDSALLADGWPALLGQDPDDVLDNLQGVRFKTAYANMTAMAAAELTAGHIVYVLGHTNAGDGGGGAFEVVAGSALAADGGVILDHDTEAFQFRRIQRSEYKPRWFKCVGDGSTADDTNFWACVDAAEDAGVKVDGEGLTYAMSALKAYSGAGVYKWRNLKLTKTAQTAADFEFMVRFTGPGFNTNPITLASNVSAGAPTFTLSDGTGLALGQIYYLMSDTEYAPSYDVTTIATGEWIRTQSVNTGTGVVTPSTLVRSSNTTANTARAYLFNQGLEIWFEDVTFIGGGIGEAQGGLRIDYGMIKQFDNVCSTNNEYTGVEFGPCVFDCMVSGVITGASLDGYGYGFLAAGCFEPQFSQVTGFNCRHLVSFGASGTYTLPGGSNVAIQGQGGGGGWAHCEGATGSVFDVHVGHNGGAFGMVTGTMLSGTGEDAITVQSPDWHFGLIRVTGGDGGVLIQSWGKPSDEPPWKVGFGEVDLGRGGTGTNYGLAIENLDDDNDTPLHVSVNSLNCRYPGLVYAEAEQANVFLHIGHLTGTSRTTHSVYALDSANGRVEISIDRADITEDAGNASIYAIQALGNTFEGSNAGQYGAQVKIGAGRITADNTAILTNDALVALDPMVKVTAPTFSSQSGIGGAQRTRRERLSANRTIYVRGDGANSNTGLGDSATGAFLTIATALTLAGTIDTNGFDLTIDLANATWTEALTLPTVIGGGRLIINGDTATPGNVVISTTSAHCITANSITGRYVIQGVKLQTTTSGDGINAIGQGVNIRYNNVEFGAVVGSQIYADEGARLVANGNYSISGGAPRHVQALRDASVDVSSRTVTITNTPAFSSQFAYVINDAIFRATGGTFSGSATGKRYEALTGGQIITGGLTLPGDSAGSVDALGGFFS